MYSLTRRFAGISMDDDRIGSRFYCCFRCRNLLAAHDDIISKSFVAKGGRRAYLFRHGMNVREGPKADRVLLTGKHSVSDMFCDTCGAELGWKYHKAYQPGNKYKEGMIVLVKSNIATAFDSTFN